MRIAVVTPYYRESDEVLRMCLESVRAQTHPDCRHFVVADGFPNDLVDEFDASHIRLPNAHGDNGNLARCIGAFAAMSEGYDAVAFLDADNWFRPDHVARVVALQADSGAVVCTSGRSVHRLDGSLLWERDLQENNGTSAVDTSCLCIFRPAFDLLAHWGMQPPEIGQICDQIMWAAIIARGISRAHDPEPTVAFRTQYAGHYSAVNEQPPPDAKTSAEFQPAIAHLKSLTPSQHYGLLLGLGGADDLGYLAASIKDIPSSRNLNVEHGGRRLRIILPDDHATSVVVDEIFRQGIYSPVPGLPPPRAILDIGANVGIAAAHFRLAYPTAEIFCVEPDPVAFTFLEINAQSIGDCKPVCAGLYFGTQSYPFHLGVSSVESSLAAVSNRSARLLMIDAGQFVSGAQRPGFDLVKIATEGAEIPLLLSLRPHFHSMAQILVRYHAGADRRLIDEMLTATHFQFRSRITQSDRGVLCYVLRSLSECVSPDAARTQES